MGSPAGCPPPGMASGEAEATGPRAAGAGASAEVVWPWALGILPLHSGVRLLYLR